ncbi:hypothetical protein [Acaryochloris sp. CCMEE 5410]|uniref:hypothetical protein n=1 Tax=Acaryochloris sp. CCMEE 5410 TaxID=310037 RepID=UPI000307E8EA|nr:hypothetical protein [Acaryochloris sp. CCMEE 5410]KAI9129374.1 hypothetical protein ON05_035220 [Acaryochloris sp. CCMEE 5410]
MVCIPTLSLKQLAILRLAKKYPGKTIQLYCELPIINYGGPPAGYTALIQKLIDLDLIEVQSKQMRCDFSRFQKKSWAKFSGDLAYPSTLVWEIWRDKFIARLKGSERVAIPGEEFEDFSYVWIQEIGVQAIQPCEDSILQ